MRMTMRLAYATVNPVTIMQPSAVMTGSNPQRWPFGAILPVGATMPSAAALTTIQAAPYPYGGSFLMATGADTGPELENEQETEALQAQTAYTEALTTEVKESQTQARQRRPSSTRQARRTE